MASSFSPPPHILFIANPESRRVTMFQAALLRCGWPAAEVVSYQALLAAEGDLTRWLAPGYTHLLFGSPGEDFVVQQTLIAWGAGDDMPAHVSHISAASAMSLEPDTGRIRYSWQWFLGYQRLLEQLAQQLIAFPGLHQLNPPAQILAMFDKVATYEQLLAAGVPCPGRLVGAASITCYDELRAIMAAASSHRVFVKLRTGSSASGVVAYRVQGVREEAITSTELVVSGGETRLYNSLRIHRYRTQVEIRSLFDALLSEGVVVEPWIPKAVVQGQGCDLRVVVIAGEARHVVLRLGRSPMTNLHLGNQRGDLAQLQEDIGEARWQGLMEVAEAGMRAFPGVHCAGLDILSSTGFRAPMVLEVNAFGDLLPGITSRGEDTYEAQLRAFG